MPFNPNPLTQAEKDRIDQLLAEGMSQKKIAAEVGRAQSTISLHCKRTGQLPVHRTPVEAIERHIGLSIEKRIERTAELMDKVMDIARKAKTGREIKEVSTAWAILIDKTAVLEGRPSSISESRTPARGFEGKTINLEEEFAKLDAKWEQEEIQSGHPGEEFAAQDTSEDA
jgi:hypothetical protein